MTRMARMGKRQAQQPGAYSALSVLSVLSVVCLALNSAAIFDAEESVVNQDIDNVLRDWEYKAGVVQARLIDAPGGRQVIQMRVDLGVLQLEVDGRPDGARPHGHDTYYDYLHDRSRAALRAGNNWVLSEEESQEADREFMQFYHRRVC